MQLCTYITIADYLALRNTTKYMSWLIIQLENLTSNHFNRTKQNDWPSQNISMSYTWFSFQISEFVDTFQSQEHSPQIKQLVCLPETSHVIGELHQIINF